MDELDGGLSRYLVWLRELSNWIKRCQITEKITVRKGVDEDNYGNEGGFTSVRRGVSLTKKEIAKGLKKLDAKRKFSSP